MDAFWTIWNFFNDNIFNKPAFFCGIIVVIGYALLRKPATQVIGGFIKAAVGYMILSVGSNGLTNSFRPILLGLNDKFGLAAAVIDPYSGQVADKALIEAAGHSLSLAMSIMVLGFLINILLVAFKKVTKVRSLMITGHTMLGQCFAVCWIVILTQPFLNDFQIILLGSILMGVWWAVSTNMTVDAVQELTGGAGFCVGHNQCFGIWAANKFGKFFGGKKPKSAGDIKFPGFLSLFNENVVATSVIMTIFFGIIMLILGPDLMHEIDSSFAATQAFGFYIVEKSLYFSVYMSILLSGVRMFVGELSKSFHGISTKLLPGTVAGLDVATTFGFAPPTCITLGFLCGAVGQFIAILGLVVFNSPVLVITGFVPVFFDNAAIAIFANRRGGIKAAMSMSFISGIIQVLGGAFCAWFYGQAAYGGARGNFDWALIWPVLTVIMKNLALIGYVATIIILLAIPQIMYLKNKNNYFKITTDYDSVKEETNKGVIA